MYRDVDTADRMLLTLADLLRSTLEQGQKQTVLLREELTFIDRYLVLEQMRFGDRLQVKREIDPATLDCRVPGLILQPLIENALKHGLSGKKEPGTLILRSWIEGNDQLILEVEDNGAGLKPELIAESQATDKPKNTGGTGIGLVNIRARLHQLFGTHATLHLEPGHANGVRARISLPAQRQ
jgi:LytS/YehU family sensor histidine kinase